MKELEEVNCEIRRIIDLQLSVLDQLKNLEENDCSTSTNPQTCYGSEKPHGGFLNNATYAWLSYRSHLMVFNVKTGENISAWTFRDRITCIAEFPAQHGELPLLLVGLDNGAIRIRDSMGLLCIFDCTTSRVLRAIKMPTGVEQACIVSGGAEWEEFNDKRPDNILNEMGGIACIVLRNLHHVMIDLQRPLWEVPNNSVIMDEMSPAELDFSSTKHAVRTNDFDKDKHAAYHLLNSRIEKHIGFNREEFETSALLEESLTPVIISSTKIGCLISGCLGRVIIWQNDGTIGWISLPADENTAVTHLALLEPTDDPRPFYYLWVVFQEESSKTPPLLRMYALLFERKYCDRGTNFYFNLEAEPSLKFEFELEEKDKVIGLSTIERESNPDQTESGIKRGEDNLLLITTNDKMLLFDLNQWYKEQMPQTISECQNPNSILASYRTRAEGQTLVENQTLSCSYMPYTLREFPNNAPTSSEELFFPNSLSLEWIELSLGRLTYWMTRGIQAELLREMAIAGPIILIQPSETFHKCLSVGLVPFNSEFSFLSDQNAQREMLLSLCLEQRWATFLIKCAREWSDGSASYLYPTFLKWGVQRAASIKAIADRLCVPLFDQSGNSIGEAEVKTLRFCSQQLECLSNVVGKLPFETADLTKQRRTLKRISTYLQVVLWFYDVGLLPETQELEEGPLPLSFALKIPYPFEKLLALYKEKRKPLNRGGGEELFIDELIMRECPVLKSQWERECTDISTDGFYPPPSLQSLLRSYLVDCHQAGGNEIECKQQITIYLLMDLAMLLQGSYPGVDQLIKYPSAFKMSPSLIKLTQAFWLLDHEDYQEFLDMMTGQLVSDPDVKEWHHKLVLRTLVRNNQHKLALIYLRVRKPPLSSVEDQSSFISLSVEHGLLQSAFHHKPPSHYAQLLISFFQACKDYGKLSDILHLALDAEEEEIFVKFLEETNSEDIRLLYYLQRCRYTEANGHPYGQYKSAFAKDMQPVSVTMLNAYNATLPNVTKRFSVNMGKTNQDVDLESRYPRPMSHYKSCNKSLGIYETVIKKAKETYFRGEKSQVPFISAPCLSLKFNSANTNMNCVLFPSLVRKDRNKRTVDDIYGDGENQSTRSTPERAKRRKLSDGTDAVDKPVGIKQLELATAFDTPLIKRKSNLSFNRETSLETPHSILKIRQLIRNSTSPTITISQTGEDSPTCDKEKKIRQIRFNISQSKRNLIQEEEVSVQDKEEGDLTKSNTSCESEEVFFSPNISANKSNSESAILSDSNYNGQNIYRPRPRPGLRSSLRSSKESLQESFGRLSNRTNLSTSSLEDCFDVSSVSSRLERQSVSNIFPSISKTSSSLLATSLHSTAILSDDSNFETIATSNKSEESNSNRATKSPEANGNYSRRSSHSLIYSERSYKRDDKQVEEDATINMECSPDRSKTMIHSRKSLRDIDPVEEQAAEDNEESEDQFPMKYKNGNITKNKETIMDINPSEDDEGRDDGDVFQSLSSTMENKESFSQVSSKSWNLKNHKPSNGFQDSSKLMSAHFDITDDESSDDEDGARGIPDETHDNKKDDHRRNDDSEVVPVQRDNVYDISNITEDESDSSMDVKERVKGKRSDTSDQAVEKRKVKRSFIKENLPLERSIGETHIRMTRSRRAASVTKDISSPAESFTENVDVQRGKRTRRASSLAKELLTGSVSTANENFSPVKNLSSSEGSTPTTKRRQSRRLSTADHESEVKDTESPTPVRRSTRRAASVQKETLEVPKSPARKQRAPSISKSIGENDDDKEAIDRKTSTKERRSSNLIATKEPVRPSSDTLTESSTIKPLSQETEESKNVRVTRSRGNSVPKESVTEKVRTRTSNVSKDVIPEVESSLESKEKKHSTRSKNFEETGVIGARSTGIRKRTSSIQSIPEELEEILSVPVHERSSSSVTQNTARQKRAMSVDISQSEVKRRTRTSRAKSIAEEPIAEEPAETETGKASKNEKQLAKVKKAPTRRKSTASGERKKDPKSMSCETDDQYAFSQPAKAEDLPLDTQTIGQVPNYVFSPPQTRSKNQINVSQHRRKMNAFISIPPLKEESYTEEKMPEKNLCGGYTRVTLNTYESRFRQKFVFPKRSKSTTD